MKQGRHNLRRTLVKERNQTKVGLKQIWDLEAEERAWKRKKSDQGGIETRELAYCKKATCPERNQTKVGLKQRGCGLPYLSILGKKSDQGGIETVSREL